MSSAMSRMTPIRASSRSVSLAGCTTGIPSWCGLEPGIMTRRLDGGIAKTRQLSRLRTTNWYSYAQNDPINYTDIQGLKKKKKRYVLVGYTEEKDRVLSIETAAFDADLGVENSSLETIIDLLTTKKELDKYLRDPDAEEIIIISHGTPDFPGYLVTAEKDLYLPQPDIKNGKVFPINKNIKHLELEYCHSFDAKQQWSTALGIPQDKISAHWGRAEAHIELWWAEASAAARLLSQ